MGTIEDLVQSPTNKPLVTTPCLSLNMKCLLSVCYVQISDGKKSAGSEGGPGLIPGSGRSPGEGNDYPCHYSCLENSMAGGAWWATVHGVTESQTRLSD